MTNETVAGADLGNQYGDYNSLSGYAGTFFPSWTDRRNNAREEIWTAAVQEGGGTCTPRHGNGTSCTAPDCETAGCNFCRASTPCQGSGQCCANSCPANACNNVMGGNSPSTFNVSVCGGTGTCTTTNQGCDGFLCASATACMTAPCADDSDCDKQHYCKADGTCAAATLITGNTCNCKVTERMEIFGLTVKVG